MYDMIIVGGGPAGMTAALYGLRNGKSCLVIEKATFGGQITHSPRVENYPGTLQMSGNEFGEKLLDQILHQGADIEMATVTGIRDDGIAVWYTITADPGILRYIVEKGSIAIDGISLTVAKVTDSDFSVSIIPHTAANTVLSHRMPGDRVNLENDIIGKYVEKLMKPVDNVSPSGISVDMLSENGFI